jgi:hypothetical protein
MHVRMKQNAAGPSRTLEPGMPKEATNEDGQPRVVGVELEFGGLNLETICARVQRQVGGTVDRRSAYDFRLCDTRLGTISMVLDAVLFRDLKVRGFLEKLHLDMVQSDLAGSIERLLATEARRFVPFEVVFAPVEFGRLPELDAVCVTFREDAEGTGAGWLNAFGLHLNPELPRVDVGTVLRYLRAFLCLYEELKEAHAVDLSRSLSPFIDPFPEKYALHVLAPDYAPDLPALIDDYLEANPTRSRPLDLLPVLAWLDEDRVRTRLPDEKISKRPALHYRLPNCRIDKPDWSITGEWNIWMRVEDLASDETALRSACENRVQSLRGPWQRIVQWIKPS